MWIKRDARVRKLIEKSSVRRERSRRNFLLVNSTMSVIEYVIGLFSDFCLRLRITPVMYIYCMVGKVAWVLGCTLA